MDKFSPKHFIFLMFATSIVSLKTYPLIFIENSGLDSWVAVIVASALFAGFYLFAVSTLKLAGTKSFLQVYQKSFGQVMGSILMILFAVTAFLVLLESASVEADSMHQCMLVETPNWYFLLFFVPPALYIVRKDLTAVVIICIIGISLITVAGINLGILTIMQKDIHNLFPVFEHGVTPGFWLSVLKCLGLYAFMSLTLVYLPQIQYRRETLMKYVGIGLLYVIQMQIISITGIFMTFSPESAQSFYYPKLIQTQLVSYFEMMEFGELYVMLQILGGWLLKYLVAFHVILQIMQSFRLKKRVIYLSSYGITALALVGSYYFTYTSIRFFASLEYLAWISLINFMLVPMGAMVAYRVKQKKTKPVMKDKVPPLPRKVPLSRKPRILNEP